MLFFMMIILIIIGTFIYSGYILYQSIKKYITLTRNYVTQKFPDNNFLYMTVYVGSIVGYILVLSLMLKMIHIIGLSLLQP
jgi:hypothetical protein